MKVKLAPKYVYDLQNMNLFKDLKRLKIIKSIKKINREMKNLLIFLSNKSYNINPKALKILSDCQYNQRITVTLIQHELSEISSVQV